MQFTIQHTSSRTTTDGFSLLELVVAVSIMLILGVVGFVSYQNYTDNARQAALDTSANQVLTAVIAADNAPDGDVETAVARFNEQSDDIMVDITAATSKQLSVEASTCEGGSSVASTSGNYEHLSTTNYMDVEYEWVGESGHSPSVKKVCGEIVQTNITVNPYGTQIVRTVNYIPPSSTFDLRPSIRQEIMRSQVYAATGSHHAADEAVNEADSASGNPGYTISDTVQNTSSVVTLEGGVTYHVSYEGAVETFAAPGHQAYGNADHSLADCLVSVDHFGESTELVNVVYIGGAKLQSMPDSLPPTVRSLRGAFENTVDFNDPSIRTWDTSNVSIMQSMFYNAKGFNQDLNTWSDGDHTYWDTENVLKMSMMFSHATEFNNGSAPGASDNSMNWNMENTYSISSMFSYTNSFNQPLAAWDTSDVQRMRFLFLHAKAFDQDISSWELPQLEDALRWDDGASKLPAEHKPAVLRG